MVREETKHETIKEMLFNEMPIDKIAKRFKVSIDEVEKIKNELEL